MEGAAYLAQLQDDPELEAQFDQIVDVIAAFPQEPNGYLTLRTPRRWAPPEV